MDQQIAQAFPTLIGRFTLPEPMAMNAELARMVREKQAASAGVRQANAGGWHSEHDLLDWPSPAIAPLRQAFTNALIAMVQSTLQLPEVQGRAPAPRGSFRLTAWANVIRHGHYHRQHNHPGSAWSGVYYVEAGASTAGTLAGVLELADPRPFTEMTEVPGSPYGQRVLIRPLAGHMVVFPGFLYHFVHPYQGEGERISIAFNAQWLPT